MSSDRIMNAFFETQVGVDNEVVETDRYINLMQIDLLYNLKSEGALGECRHVDVLLGKRLKGYRHGNERFAMLRLSEGLTETSATGSKQRWPQRSQISSWT